MEKKLLYAINLAEEKAWSQKCEPPRIRRIVLEFDGFIYGSYLCEDEEKVCDELLWALNDVLEKMGYTAIWKMYEGSRRFDFRAYKRVEEMLPIIEW